MNRLAKRLDPRLDEIPTFHELTEAENFEIDHIRAIIDEAELNMTLSHTTASKIEDREYEFGVVSDPSKSIEQRRAVLVAKLRGQAVTTPSSIIDLAIDFDLGLVSVDETRAPYTVTIIFEEYLGIPANMADFIAAIEEVKPAHLVFQYIYKYNTWGDYVGFHHTLGEWRDEIKITWGGIRTYEEGNVQEGPLQTLAAEVAATIRKAVNRVGIHK